jgi:hypothetical protein
MAQPMLALLKFLDGSFEQARSAIRDNFSLIEQFVNQQTPTGTSRSGIVPLVSESGNSASGSTANLTTLKLSGLQLSDVLEIIASFHGQGTTAEGFNLKHHTDQIDLGTDNSTPTVDATCRWTLAAIPRNPKQITCQQFLPTDDGGIALPGGCTRQQTVTVLTDWTGDWTLALRGAVTGGGPPNLVQWQWTVRKHSAETGVN